MNAIISNFLKYQNFLRYSLIFENNISTLKKNLYNNFLLLKNCGHLL